MTSKPCASALRKKLDKPVIPVNIPGFVGQKNLGNKLAGETLLDYVIGTMEPEYTTPPFDINLIAEFNVAGDMWLVKPLLINWAFASCLLLQAMPNTRKSPGRTVQRFP